MGSQNSKFLSQQELPHQYRPIKQLPNVYESLLNGSRFQKHKLELNSEADIKYEKQIFIFRRMHADYLISAHFFQKFTPSHFCNISYQVCFFTQYPMYGFSLDFILPIDKTFQVLLDCLRGFELLFTKFGAFNVSSKNIFFDINHKPRVWISSNVGKTRVQNINYYNKQYKMIIDIFKLFDHIKDQRNIKFTFSNYLSKIQQKSNSLTFKNVILYLVKQASRFFVNRTRSKEKQKNLMSSNYSSLINNLTYRSQEYNQNNFQVISLKTRNRKRNSCDSVGNKGPVNINYNKLNEFEGIAQYDKTKKSKRHNSQQDCKSREFNLFKQNKVVFNGDQLITLNKPQVHHNFLQSNNSRIPKQQYNCSQTFRQKPQKNKIKIEKKTAKLTLNQALKDVQHSKNLNQKKTYKIVETQIESQNTCKINPNYKSKNVKFVKHQQRNIIQSNSKAQNILESNKQNIFKIPASQDFNQSQFILNNLQTFKSIVNSQYSDIYSEIGEDLQSYHF